MAGFSVKKPLTIFVTVLGIIVLGVVAYLKMTPDLLPNMDFPYVIIVTSDPGASPESIEQSITRPVEQSMATLDKIKTVTSTSQDSVSMVILEFEDGANMDTISVDIQQKISVLQGSWDDTVSAPYVLKINPSMLPVMVAAVSREDMDVYALSDFVTGELSPKLEGVSGVASISVSGAVTREAHVILDEAKLDALSEKLADAVRTELNKTKLDLQKAKDQVEKGQAQLDEAKEAIAAGAAAKAGAAVDKLYEYLKEARGQIPGPDPDPDPGKPPIKEELEQLKKTLERLNATLDKLMQDLESGELKREVTSEVYDLTLSLIDGITQLTEAQIQLDEAMTQIEAGMDQINEAYKSIADQTDVGGMLSISAVSQLLTAQNFAMPAGYIEDDSGVKYMVSVGENVSSRQELEDMVLLDLGMDGIEPVTLGDIATVVVTDNAGELYTKVNGDNGILITFTKQSNYATAEVSNNISARFEELEGQYEGLSFAPLMDQGDYIYLIVETITSSLLWGALFSVVILYLFLRDWRPTVITLVSIPVSVIFAIVLMYFTGVTINMISLSGLAVAVGMLVDNSVVVIENIYRLRAKGATIIQAAVSGPGAGRGDGLYPDHRVRVRAHRVRRGPDPPAVHRPGADHHLLAAGQPAGGADTGAGDGQRYAAPAHGAEAGPAGQGLSRLSEGHRFFAGPQGRRAAAVAGAAGDQCRRVPAPRLYLYAGDGYEQPVPDHYHAGGHLPRGGGTAGRRGAGAGDDCGRRAGRRLYDGRRHHGRPEHGRRHGRHLRRQL